MPETADHLNSLIFMGGKFGGKDALERVIDWIWCSACCRSGRRFVQFPLSAFLTLISSVSFIVVIRERKCCSYQFFPLPDFGLGVLFVSGLEGTKKEGEKALCSFSVQPHCLGAVSGVGAGDGKERVVSHSLFLSQPVYKLTQRQVNITVQKKVSQWWERLTKQEKRPLFLAPDFDRWLDESDAEMELRAKVSKDPRIQTKIMRNSLGHLRYL